MSEIFELDPRLEQDSIWLADWPLCQIRLHNDKNYPWFILVPRKAGLTELIDLTPEQQQQLWRESNAISGWLQQLYPSCKLNIAALGNVVSQLHIHHIARFEHDASWPAPVWGKVAAIPYSIAEIDQIRQRFRRAFISEV